jgi:hypothetical protein
VYIWDVRTTECLAYLYGHSEVSCLFWMSSGSGVVWGLKSLGCMNHYATE